jgi:hypothetical protein
MIATALLAVPVGNVMVVLSEAFKQAGQQQRNQRDTEPP